MSNKIRTIISIAVTVVWTLNFLASLAIPGYEAPPEINSIFMGTVGVALATSPMFNRASEDSRPPAEDDQERQP